MSAQIRIYVAGSPVPKQSTRVVVNGSGKPHGILPARMREWQATVQIEAMQVMRDKDLLKGDVVAHITFFLPDHRRKDLDNLSKGTLDGLRGVAFTDDSQVVELHLYKKISKLQPAASITLYEAEGGAE